MYTLAQRYTRLWRDKELLIMTILSMILLALAGFVLNPLAVEFATNHASNPVEDLVLSNIPVFDVSWYFVYGMFALIAFITVLCLRHPNRIAFVLYSLTLFILIRCVFVSLTHMAPAVDHPISEFGPGITKAFFGADLFFSGHTGSPFLMALVFWHRPILRYLFLLWSVFFGIVVLAGHFHYSIDVLAAFFITYGIYQIALWLFPREREAFLRE